MPRPKPYEAQQLRVEDAEEDTLGYVTARVIFPDGLTQTVRLPKWASKQNIKDEAVRIRFENEQQEYGKKPRKDLKD